MINEYIQKDGKVLRRGYTTGTCASAAAKAATAMLFSGEKIKGIEVTLPVGEKVVLEIEDAIIGNGEAKCLVVKDAGDDPDVTDKAKICALAKKIERGVVLKGGEGIGKVTKPGLQVEIGDAAINPVPKKMIFNEIKEILPDNKGVEVTISVPKGRELAKKTMNQKLGIIGGISIIGTTGIVEPMSKDAFKTSLVPQIDVALAKGYREIVLTPGRIGERNAISRGVPEDAVIQMSNFIGFMLEACVERGIKKALLTGHLSKLTKVAAGIFDTHSKVADAKFETIAAHSALLGADREIIKLILEANTTERALEILREYGLIKVFDSIAERASFRAMEYVDGKMEIGTILLSLNGEVVGRDKKSGESQWARFLL